MGKADFLNEIATHISNLKSEDSKTVILNGQRIGPGKGAGANLVKGTTVSKSSQEAKTQELYEQARLGGIKEDLDEKEIEKVVDKYIEQIIDEIFDGTS